MELNIINLKTESDITYMSELTLDIFLKQINLGKCQGLIRRRPYGLRLTSLSFRKSSAH